MATVKKSKKKIVVPICIILVIAIIACAVFGVSKANAGEAVSLYTIGTDDIYEKVSLTGDVTAGSTKEYKVSAVATVKEVFVNVGDSVKKGDVLATFDTTSLDSQINSLQTSYNDAVKNYNNSVAAQKTAQSKADALEESIEELENQIGYLENLEPTTAAKKQTTTKKANPTAAPTSPSKPAVTEEPSTEATEPSTPDQPSVGSLTAALEELNKTLTEITQDIETLTKSTEIIASTISSTVGKLDNEAIAQLIVQNLVDSGIAEEMAQQIVDSIDVDAIVNSISSTPDAQLTAAQIQLVALQAQYAIYSAQADDTVVNAQKTAVETSKKALDALKEEKQAISEGWIAAFDGTITAVDVTAGNPTTAFTSGITLENLDSMTATVSLSEYDVHKVRVGMAATVTTAFGTYDGEVTSIAPTATGGSGTSILDSVGSMAGISGLSSLTQSGAGVECKVTIKDTDENIIVGFDANVEIETGEHLGVVVVPIESIKLDKDGSYVYLYNEEEQTATKTKIETGAVSSSAYEVKSGLKAGDKVISAPSSTYEDDTFKVKIKK